MHESTTASKGGKKLSEVTDVINILENPHDCTDEQIAWAIGKATDILKSIANYKEGVVSK